jgi:hypothetical protein
MPLLGKISAVLSANTQDFTRGIRQAGRELDDFRRTSQGLQLNLGRDSIDRTLTSLQRFQRQLQEIRNQIATDGSLRLSLPNPSVLAAQFRVFQDVGRPLTDLKNKIEGLSNTLQSGLYPELERIQGRFQGLFRTIAEGPRRLQELRQIQAALTQRLSSTPGSSPEAARLRTELAAATREADGLRRALDVTNQQRSVDSMVAAIQRLSRATAAAKDIGTLTGALDASGVGASFYQPRAKEALTRTKALRSAAEALPVRFRGAVFADLTQRGEENALAIEQEMARLQRAEGRLARGATRTRQGPRQLQQNLALEQEREAAQARLNALVRRQEGLNRQLSKEQISASIAETSQGREFLRRDRVAEAQKFAGEYKDLANSLREISATRFQNLIASAGDVAEQFNRGAASAEKMKRALGSLRDAKASSEGVKKAEAEFDEAFSDPRITARNEIRRRAQTQRNLLPPGSVESQLVSIRERAELGRELFNRNAIPRFNLLEQSAGKIADPAYKRELEDIRSLSMKVDSALRQAFSATEIGQATQALQRFESLLSSLNIKYETAESRAKKFREASSQVEMFRRESGSSSEKLDPRLQRAGVSLMVMRQAVGQFSEKAASEDARRRANEAIEKSQRRIETLTEVRARVSSSESLTEDQRKRRLEKLDKRVEGEVEKAKQAVVSESGGRISATRLQSQIDRQVKNTGSFAIAGAASAQLAVQQGLFAIDDFMSATGGVEYKLRAIGNNISQLGLLLGQSGMIPGLSATTGLFIGMAAVLGGHLAIAIGKAVFGLDEADARFKAMNEMLDKSKSSADATAKSYEALAKSIRESVSVGAASGRSGIERKIADIKEDRQKAFEDFVAARSPEMLDARARVSAAQKRVEEARNPGERARLLRDLEFEERQERNIRRREMRLAPTRGPRGGEAEELALLEERSKTIRSQQKNSDLMPYLMANYLPEFLLQFDVGFDGGDGRGKQYAARNKELVEIEARIAELKGMVTNARVDSVLRGYETGKGAASAAESAFQGLGQAGADADIQAKFGTRIQKAADALSKELDEAFKAATEDRPAEMEIAMKAAEEAAAALSDLARQADAVTAEFRLGGRRSVESMLQNAGELVGDRPSIVGTQVARAKVEFDQAVEARRRAEESGDALGVNLADMRIEIIRNFAASLEKGAIAIASFNRAAEAAATGLSSTLVREAQSSTEQARRRANRLLGDPLEGAQSVAEERDARDRQRAMERANRELAAAMDDERDALAADMAAGRAPEAARLATRVQQQNAIANDMTDRYSDEDRRRAKAAAERAQAELDEILEERPRVRAARGEVDALDAAEQARLEESRKRREEVSRQFSPAGSNIDAANRMFSSAGDVEGLIDSAKLARRREELQKRLSDLPAGSDAAENLKNELEDVKRQSARLRDDAVRGAERQALSGGGFEEQFKAARRRLDASGPSNLDEKLMSIEIRRRDLEQRRDDAAGAGNEDAARDAQAEIDALDAWTAEINATAIALEGFKNAVERAAMALQDTVLKESESAAFDARRRANEAEALFGGNSPQAREARERQDKLEERARAAQDENDSARAEIAKERVAFEAGMDPAQKARAEKIRELDEKASNKRLDASEREAAAAEAQRLRREQEREFEERPGVKAARQRSDKADADLQRARAADRGRELVKSDIERRREDAARRAAEVAAYVNQVKDDKGPAAARREAQKGAIELAKAAAPLYAQFGEELANARLQGPSRAALRVQDIGTTEGANELNRLLRGDDEAKNVNLVEMQRQTQLLQEIEATLRRQTGFPVLI